MGAREVKTASFGSWCWWWNESCKLSVFL